MRWGAGEPGINRRVGECLTAERETELSIRVRRQQSRECPGRPPSWDLDRRVAALRQLFVKNNYANGATAVDRSQSPHVALRCARLRWADQQLRSVLCRLGEQQHAVVER